MADDNLQTYGIDYEIDDLLPIVVGVQPHAEMYDRPLAYRLRDQVLSWQETFCEEPVIVPLVLSDVWFLNHEIFETRPVLSVGGPRLNALTALLTDRLPVVAVEEEAYLVQLGGEEEAGRLRACLWGSKPNHTERALDIFLQEFFDDWMSRLIELQAATKTDQEPT